jgi:2-dehydropantoate 2-reductase
VKLVMNCVFNAISALGRARYGRMIQEPGIRALMADVVRECVAVARAEGVPLNDAEDLFRDAMRLGEAMSAATSSMAQDLSLGRPTENDALNGHVAQRAQALGIAAPANAALAALVRLLEAGVVNGGVPTRTA